MLVFFPQFFSISPFFFFFFVEYNSGAAALAPCGALAMFYSLVYYTNIIVINVIFQVVKIRNALSHMALTDNLMIDNATFKTHWADVLNLVSGFPHLGNPYFTGLTLKELQVELNKVSKFVYCQ